MTPYILNSLDSRSSPPNKIQIKAVVKAVNDVISYSPKPTRVLRGRSPLADFEAAELCCARVQFIRRILTRLVAFQCTILIQFFGNKAEEIIAVSRSGQDWPWPLTAPVGRTRTWPGWPDPNPGSAEPLTDRLTRTARPRTPGGLGEEGIAPLG
jgi:hypothetical protein